MVKKHVHKTRNCWIIQSHVDSTKCRCECIQGAFRIHLRCDHLQNIQRWPGTDVATFFYQCDRKWLEKRYVMTRTSVPCRRRTRYNTYYMGYHTLAYLDLRHLYLRQLTRDFVCEAPTRIYKRPSTQSFFKLSSGLVKGGTPSNGAHDIAMHLVEWALTSWSNGRLMLL